MSGEQELKTVDEQLREIKQTINGYYQQLNLEQLGVTSEVDKYLEKNEKQRSKMLPEECAIAASILHQHAAYLQIEVNRQLAVINFCNKRIMEILGDKVSQYGSKYTKYEQRLALAIKESEVAQKLQAVRNEAQLRVDTLNYLPPYITNIARSYETLSRTQVGRGK